MRVVESGLIPVYENEQKEQLVNARELFEFLRGVETSTKFTDWINDKIKRYEFVEDVDFTSFSQKNEKGGRPTLEYVLKIDTAKEIAMVENNEKGRQVRRYFIAVEKRVKQKHFESIDHFKKEQMMLEFTIDKLKVNEGSKIKMIKQFNEVHNLSTEYLPDYTEEKITKSLSELLKQYHVDISVIKMNQLLLGAGILEEKERPSRSKGTKKYKALTEKGLKYGKNLISSHGSQKETQPHYYEDTFEELLKLVKEMEQEAC